MELTPADFKALALVEAYVALAKTLSDSGVMTMEHLLSNLSGARARLQQLGENEAAKLLGQMNETLTAI
jgi:hypothetical protein